MIFRSIEKPGWKCKLMLMVAGIADVWSFRFCTTLLPYIISLSLCLEH
jgi:hypothetical protein